MNYRFAWGALLPVVAALYWIALFIATQIPRQFQFLERGRDKILHFGAFAGLGFLVALCAAQWWRLTWGNCLRIICVLAAYGALDEYLQGVLTTTRKSDWKDWVMDVAGSIAGVLLAAAVSNWIFPSADVAQNRSID